MTAVKSKPPQPKQKNFNEQKKLWLSKENLTPKEKQIVDALKNNVPAKDLPFASIFWKYDPSQMKQGVGQTVNIATNVGKSRTYKIGPSINKSREQMLTELSDAMQDKQVFEKKLVLNSFINQMHKREIILEPKDLRITALKHLSEQDVEEVFQSSRVGSLRGGSSNASTSVSSGQ